MKIGWARDELMAGNAVRRSEWDPDRRLVLIDQHSQIDQHDPSGEMRKASANMPTPFLLELAHGIIAMLDEVWLPAFLAEDWELWVDEKAHARFDDEVCLHREG